MAEEKKKYLGLDVDGSFFLDAYPSLGEPAPDAVRVCKRCNEEDVLICVFTMRDNEKLDEAVEAIEGEGVELYGINENPDQHTWTTSPKVHYDLLVDDKAAGCPLVHPEDGGKPYVDWNAIEDILIEKGLLSPKS